MQSGKQEQFKVACTPPPRNTLWACAWHTVLVGLNLDVFELPSAEEGFEHRSLNTFMSTFLKSWKAEKYHWNNNRHFLQPCFEGQCSFLHGFWKTALIHITAKFGAVAFVPGRGSCTLQRTGWSLSLGGSYSLPCVISHAAYLLQILFFFVVSNSSQHCPYHQPHSVPWILSGKREESGCPFIPLVLNGFSPIPVWWDFLNHRGHTFCQLREAFQSQLKVWRLLK